MTMRMKSPIKLKVNSKQAKSFAQEDASIESEVIFEPTEKEPHCQKMEGMSFFHCHDAQAEKLALMLHRCFLQTYNLRDGLKEFGGTLAKKAMRLLSRKQSNFMGEMD